MPDYATSMLAIIRDEVSAGRPVVAKMGTVASRDTTGPRATVVFDGSSGTAQPVKCFENVVIAPGDRVGLIRYESEWIVTGNYSPTGLAYGHLAFTFAAQTDSTSATYVDMPSSPTVTYEKMRDDTLMEFHVEFSMRNSVSTVTTKLGLRVTASDGSIDYDQDVRQYAVNAINIHTTIVGTVRAAAGHPAGGYIATGRWMRTFGTDVMRVDTNDVMMITAREVWA